MFNSKIRPGIIICDIPGEVRRGRKQRSLEVLRKIELGGYTYWQVANTKSGRMTTILEERIYKYFYPCTFKDLMNMKLNLIWI